MSVIAVGKFGTVLVTPRVQFVRVIEERESIARIVSCRYKMPSRPHDRERQNVRVTSITGSLGVIHNIFVLSDVTQAFASAVDKRQ